VKHKLFKVNIVSQEEALTFIDWIHGVEAPFHLQINDGPIDSIENGIQKLFWLTGFESLIEIED